MLILHVTCELCIVQTENVPQPSFPKLIGERACKTEQSKHMGGVEQLAAQLMFTRLI